MAQRVTAKIARTKNFRNFRNGDIVLLKAETHRNHWPVARMIETFADTHGVVQTVRLKLGIENNAQREQV